MAYRLEPLLTSAAAADIPESAYVPAAESSLTNDKNGVRLHLQGQKTVADLGKEVGRAAMKMNKRFGSMGKSMFGALDQLSRGLGVEDGASAPPPPPPSAPMDTPPTPGSVPAVFAIGSDGEEGGARVDLMLQTGLIENELLSALSAHTSYFTNEDYIALLVREIERGVGGGEEDAGMMATSSSDSSEQHGVEPMD